MSVGLFVEADVSLANEEDPLPGQKGKINMTFEILYISD